MKTQHTVGIAGAGLLGRLLAWTLARAGCAVTVFDPACGPAPRFHEAHSATRALQAAGFTAAGMLSPVAELDNAAPAVAVMGWASITWWHQITQVLQLENAMSHGGSWLVCHGQDLGSAQRVLNRLEASQCDPTWQAQAPTETVRKVPLSALVEQEPAIQGIAHAWHLPGEAHIHTVATLEALHTQAPSVVWQWQTPVASVETNGQLVMGDGQTQHFDTVIDTRGLGAKKRLSVRGVRGEVVWLHLPHHGLQRPVRLLHPRHRVYIVPRQVDTVLVGATEIETEDDSAVSLKSAVELMSAAHSVMPTLAEARLLRWDVNLRPALPDNGPLVEWNERRLTINGLFRHGWLLAPALADQGLRTSGLLPNGLAAALS